MDGSVIREEVQKERTHVSEKIHIIATVTYLQL